LPADEVVAREDVVLNPYYRHMGGLYGSEYWTHLLPRRVGADVAARLTGPPFIAMGTRRAVEVGLLGAAFGSTLASFRAGTRARAERLARSRGLGRRLAEKRLRRARDRRRKPLEAYRAEEMARAHRCFFGPTAAITRPGGASSTSSARLPHPSRVANREPRDRRTSASRVVRVASRR
jgi:putative two-component system hydrogenase maturation factor HypX/HoxX